MGNARTRAREMRRAPTDAERALWSRLRGRAIERHKFRRQAPIGGYIVDFVCFERCFVVEVDGGQHMAAAAEDDRRTTWLRAQGFRVVRFWNHEVLMELDRVVEAIAEALGVSGEGP